MAQYDYTDEDGTLLFQSRLHDMRKRSASPLLFPSPFDVETVRDASAVGHRLSAVCRSLGLSHATPHGLRSYFVTQARESGHSDAEIATLIGDMTGPAIIALTYGDVRPDHLLKQAQRIRLTVQAGQQEQPGASSINRSNTSPDVSERAAEMPHAAKAAQVAVVEWV